MTWFKFHRPVAGLEISEGFVRAAQVLRDKRGWRLIATAEVPFPEETLKLSYKTQNINDPQAFMDAVKEAMNRSGIKAGRVGLSVPNEIAGVLVQRFRELPESRRDTEKMLAWWAKRNLSLPTEGAKISYAQLGENGSGEKTLLVACCSEQVIREYELNLKGLGIDPVVVRPAGVNHFNFYGPHIPPKGTVAFLGLFERFFTFFAIENGTVRFYYGRKTTYADIHFFQDVEMVMMMYLSEDGPRSFERICFASEIGLDKELQEGLRSLTSTEVVRLDEGEIAGPQEENEGGETPGSLAGFAAAIGAAQSLG